MLGEVTFDGFEGQEVIYGAVLEAAIEDCRTVPFTEPVCVVPAAAFRTLLDELDRVEKERDAFSDAFAQEQQAVRNIVAAAGPRDEEHDIFDHLKAMRASLSLSENKLGEAVKALELVERVAVTTGDGIAKPSSLNDFTEAISLARSTLALLKPPENP